MYGLGYCGKKRGDRSKASIEAISQIKSTSPPALCAILRLGNGSDHGNKRGFKGFGEKTGGESSYCARNRTTPPTYFTLKRVT